MKKRFLYIVLASVALTSCRKDEIEIIPEVEISTQDTYDDEAATNFLQTHYFDSKGNIKDFVATDTVNVKLADLVPAPVKLPSGVIYLVRANAQPDPGTVVGSTDVINFFSRTFTYVATKTDDKVQYSGASFFKDNIGGTGIPDSDPIYYYVKQKVLNDTSQPRSYFEIEGLKEGLSKFKAFDLPDEAGYNLQGLIIVPSRAAFARDLHYNFNNVSYRNRSFVFNFQLYKSRARLPSEM